MLRPTPRAWIALLLVVCCLVLPGAAAPEGESADDLVRRANDQFRAGDRDAADALYARAEELTADPGLVAFNRGAVLFDRAQAALTRAAPDEAAKHLAEAARHYERALRDADCPPARAARAWYNRGTCLLHLGGSWNTYRAAVACFEHTLDSPVADEALKADARANLERAKLLCIQERQKDENKKKSPNQDVPPEEQPRPEPEPRFGPSDLDPGAEQGPGTERKSPAPKSPGAQAQQANAPAKGTDPDRTAAGNSAAVEVLKDSDAVQNLTPGGARATLEATARRIKREQQSLLRGLYGPDRPGVRDW